jgi:hypothetical protein
MNLCSVNVFFTIFFPPSHPFSHFFPLVVSKNVVNKPIVTSNVSGGSILTKPKPTGSDPKGTGPSRPRSQSAPASPPKPSRHKTPIENAERPFGTPNSVVSPKKGTKPKPKNQKPRRPAKDSDSGESSDEIISRICSTGRRKNNSKLYTPELIAEVVAFSEICGRSRTVKHYKKRGIAKTTIHRWLDRIEAGVEIKQRKNHKKPALPPNIDQQLLEAVEQIRKKGLEVHIQTVIALIRTILAKNNLSTLLKENGGKLSLKESWAANWLAKHNLSLRVVTQPKTVKVFTNQDRLDFLRRIALRVKDYQVVKPLVLNADETSIQLSPAGKTTYAEKGTDQVPIVCHRDKRSITATLGATVDCIKLNPQLIFSGTTSKCHPSKDVDGILYSHSKSHWQTEETTLELLKKVIIPFLNQRKIELGLPASQKSILLWDVWNTHVKPSVINYCHANNICMIIITPGFTAELQLLDLVANYSVKQAYRAQFRDWLQAEMLKRITRGNDYASAHEAIGLKDIKNLVPVWFKAAWDTVDPTTLQKGWNKIGINECWKREFQEEAELHRARLFPRDVLVSNDDVMPQSPEDEEIESSLVSISFLLLLPLPPSYLPFRFPATINLVE